jgi:hypothetical protein
MVRGLSASPLPARGVREDRKGQRVFGGEGEMGGNERKEKKQERGRVVGIN